jgi:hypothetical protein
MRSFASAKSAVEAVASRQIKAVDLPASPMIDRVYEIEFELATAEMEKAKKDRLRDRE